MHAEQRKQHLRNAFVFNLRHSHVLSNMYQCMRRADLSVIRQLL